MENFFDKATHYLGRNKSNVFIINIGAMDGVLFDELIGYTLMYNFGGLYVEPIPYLFDKLKTNITVDNSFFENSAISDYNGKIKMLTIKRDAIDSGLVHNCFYGMSAVYPPKNGLGSEFDRPTVEKYGEEVNVECITLDRLLRKHKVYNFDIIKIDAEGHDYTIFKQIDFEEFRPKVVRLEWINLNDLEKESILSKFNEFNYRYEISGQDIVGLPYEFYEEVSNSFLSENNIPESSKKIEFDSKKNVTLVTGLWDIGRDLLQEGWSRNYDHYLKKLDDLLGLEQNLIIFGDENLREYVLSRRSESNTHFIVRDLTWFVNNDFYHKIQKIRTDPKWYNQIGWLSESTQAKLEMYNPIVMSKMFLLHDAKILDKFDSDYMFWIDAGLSNTVHPGYFTHDNVLEKIVNLTDKFMFICFPYETNTEIHGFKFQAICEMSKERVTRVARAGFFGGSKNFISNVNSIYYHLLRDSLDDGYMGTEESIFTIMTYLHPELIDTFFIEGNGLLGKFFEDVKNDVYKKRTESNSNLYLSELLNIDSNETMSDEEVALYVIGFNSPNQFKTLIHSMLTYDKNFIDKPKKYLLDNSTDLSTTDQYLALCKSYGFEHIKKNNIGITGGRQWIAEHFNDSIHKYYFFFEDDMFFSDDKLGRCRNGFGRYVSNMYEKLVSLMKKENFDFIKLNYSEFFGDNGTQWAWYNVPQHFRQSQWPNNTNLPHQGLDPNSPKTKYDSIKSFEGLPYTTGEVFYCNWPQIMSKDGNKKCFINTKFASPYEQTLMSFIFQETVKGFIKPALLLLSPTEHNRFEHYDASLRKEC